MSKLQNKNKQKRRSIAIVAGFAMLKLAFTFFGNHLQVPSTMNLGLMTSILSNGNIISLTNTARKDNDISVITSSKLLREAAQEKARDMLINEYFAHTSPDGKTPWDFIDATGYKYRYAGENLAIHFDSTEHLIEGWMISPGHRKNILNEKYTEIGIGIARGTFESVPTTVVVQMFAQPIKTFSIVPGKTSAFSSGMPEGNLLSARVKGASIEKTILELEEQNLAEWNREATTAEIFAGPVKKVPASGLFKSLYTYMALFAVSLLAYRFVTKKYYRDRIMTAEFLFILISLLVLVNL